MGVLVVLQIFVVMASSVISRVWPPAWASRRCRATCTSNGVWSTLYPPSSGFWRCRGANTSVLSFPQKKKYRSWALDIQNWLRQQWASPKALTLCRFCRISKSLPTNKCQDRFPEAPVPPLGLCHGPHAPSRWNQPLGLCWIWHLSKWLLESMGGLAGLPGCCLRANNHGGSSQGQENGSWKQTGDGRRLSKNKSDTSLLYGAFFYSVSVTLDSYYNFQIFYSKFSNLLVFDIDSLVKSIYI